MAELHTGEQATPADPSSLRRTPNQQRSRERVEKILSSAKQLIAAQGSDALRMNEVAKVCGISIGSLYQYFPDKASIIQTLAERYNEMGKACIEEGLAPVRTIDELCDAFAALVDEYYEMFLAEPVMRDIWSGTQADKELRQIELANSRKLAADLVQALNRFPSTISKEELTATAFLLFHLGESTMRLAISVDKAEGKLLVDGYKRLALTELRRISSPSP